MERVREQIDSLVDRIKDFNAKEIILFGSYTDGTANEDSDVDLCVITREREKRKIEIIKELRRAIATVLSYPVDLLVYDEEEFYERANATSSFEYKIKTKGVEVYEQQGFDDIEEACIRI